MKYTLKIKPIPIQTGKRGRPFHEPIDMDKQRTATEIAETTNLSALQVGLIRKTGYKHEQKNLSYNDIEYFFEDTKVWFKWADWKKMPKFDPSKMKA